MGAWIRDAGTAGEDSEEGSVAEPELSQGSRLRLSGVSKAFGRTQALADVDLVVEAGQIHALLGSNGCGKSTLIKIVAGVYEADAGTLELGGRQFDLTDANAEERRRTGLRVVHQQPTIFPGLTVAENLALGKESGRLDFTRVKPRELRACATTVLERFGISARPQDSAGELAPAMQMMVVIARALQSEDHDPDRVLILDEPTASLSPTEATILFEALRRYASDGETIVLVTHRLDEVMEVADVASVLRDGRNAGRLERDQMSEERLGELIVGRSVDAYFPSRAVAPGAVAVLELEGVRGGRVRGVDLTVNKGEVVGLAGFEESGCTEVLDLLHGLLPLEEGEVRLAGSPVRITSTHDAVRAGFAYVPADRAANGIFPDLSLQSNLSQATLSRYRRFLGMNRRAEVADARTDIERFNIRTPGADAPVSELSGGNQQKSVIARWLRAEPKVLLLSDPTQGVDIGARRELWTAIDSAVDRGSAVLMTASDHEELAHVADRVLVMHDGRVVAELSGADLTAHAIATTMNRATTAVAA
jgi:ribose transport system ATP-binding protein